MNSQHEAEIRARTRFAFGKNWSRFLLELDDSRIRLAEQSLCEMLELGNLQGKRFLDIGCGSGLFSLAARGLGATVTSFDYDSHSVACAAELRRRYSSQDPAWRIEQASVLDSAYLNSLGQYDVVYSRGVLHHTGNISLALENVLKLVALGGKLFIAIYNDQGRASKFWLKVKIAYNKVPRHLRWLILWPAALRLWGPTTMRDCMTGHPFRTWRNYPQGSLRGMSAWRDLVDWVGGLPFEVGTPAQIFNYYQDRGFRLERLKTCAGGHGCNEYVFLKVLEMIESEPSRTPCSVDA